MVFCVKGYGQVVDNEGGSMVERALLYKGLTDFSMGTRGW